MKTFKLLNVFKPILIKKVEFTIQKKIKIINKNLKTNKILAIYQENVEK